MNDYKKDMIPVWVSDRERLRVVAAMLTTLSSQLDFDSDRPEFQDFSSELTALANKMISFDARCLSLQYSPEEVKTFHGL